MIRTRPVLFPFGQADREDVRDRCLEMVRRLGGDLARIIDGPSATLDEFAAHVARISKSFTEREPPLVVIAKTSPLTLTAVAARKKLVASSAILDGSTWAIYYDPIDNPHFLNSARDLGEFDREFKDAPYWTGPEELKFLVLSPFIVDLGVLEKRVTMRVKA